MNALLLGLGIFAAILFFRWLGTPTASRRLNGRIHFWLAIGYCLSAIATGCASHKSTVIRKTSAEGTTEITRSATRTLFDSKSRLADNRVESIGPSNSQTIAIGSLAQESSGSNFVAALEKAAVLMERMEKLKTSLPELPDIGSPQGAREGAKGATMSIGPTLTQEELLRLLGTNYTPLVMPPGSTDATARQNLRRALRQQTEGQLE